MKSIKIVFWLITVSVIAARAQEFRVDLSADIKSGSGYFDHWDPVQDKLMFYRDVGVATSPGIRVVQKDGNVLAIFPLRDFPGARRMTLWDVSATTDGGVIVSVIAEFGPREIKPVPVKALLLTYDASGKLTKVWDTQPYHHTLLAVNEEDEVFALGGKDSTSKDFPLVVKYSPNGEVVREFLPASTFPSGDAVVQQGSPNGESQMFIFHKELFLWLAPLQELFRFSMTGDSLGRVSLQSALNQLAVSIGAQKLKVARISAMQDGRLMCQIVTLPTVKGEKARHHQRFA